MKRAWIIVTTLLFLPLTQVEAACVTPFFHEEEEIVMFGRHAIADFDQDGKDDIAAAGGGALILLAGNGTFVPDAPVSLYDGGAVEVITADMNDDDELDIVFSDASNIGILFGGPGRTFTGPTLVAAANYRRIVAGDFNEDGRMDLFAVTNSGGAIFLQDAEGQFAGSGLSAGAFSSTPRDIVAGDFDLNGDLDIIAIVSGGIGFLPGKGDGTFWPFVTGLAAGSGGGSPMELDTADLDGDGDLDIVSTDVGEPSVKVWLNQTGYSWSATFYPLLAPNGLSGRPMGLTLADFNGDGMLDIAAGGTLAAYLAVLTGNGNATFDEPTYTIIDSEEQTFEGLGTLNVLGAIDLDLDGRIDIVGEQQRLGFNSVFQNLCGLADVEAEAPELISVGQTLQIPVLVAAEAEEGPVPTGSVTLLNGDVTLHSATLANGEALLETNALGAGTYTLTVTYSGDANFDAGASEPMAVTVTTETTTTTLTKSLAESSWGQPVTFTASVTATDNSEPIEGTVELWIDGQLAASGPAPSLLYEIDTLPAGTHALEARYAGSEDHPPSSTTASHVVNRVQSEVTIRSTPSTPGTAAVIEVLLGLPYNNLATGAIRLYEGGTLLGTIDAINQPRIFTVTLAMGTHELRAFYDGDADVIGDSSPVLRHVVLANTNALDANGTGASVRLTWGPPPAGTTQIRLMRSAGNGAFAPLATFDASVRNAIDMNVSSNTVYRYQVEYLDGAGAVIGSSNVDIGRPMAFTNDGDLGGRPMLALYYRQLRDTTNSLRAAAGLPPITMEFTGVVRASHITQLRTAIDEARAVFGAIPFLWEPGVAPGGVIRAVHVQQLRDAVR